MRGGSFHPWLEGRIILSKIQSGIRRSVHPILIKGRGLAGAIHITHPTPWRGSACWYQDIGSAFDSLNNNSPNKQASKQSIKDQANHPSTRNFSAHTHSSSRTFSSRLLDTSSWNSPYLFHHLLDTGCVYHLTELSHVFPENNFFAYQQPEVVVEVSAVRDVHVPGVVDLDHIVQDSAGGLVALSPTSEVVGHKRALEFGDMTE